MDSEDTHAGDEGGRSEAEAQRAADGLKEQIAKVRARVHSAQDELRRRVDREREPRSFKR